MKRRIGNKDGKYIFLLKILHFTLNLFKKFIYFYLFSVCNRTYYGETGKTYELGIRSPKEIPFICRLNFTAPGGAFGDIVQVSIFHVYFKYSLFLLLTS